MAPAWLHALAIAFVLLGVACALGIAVDVLRHPQRMGVMNVVWPVTALFGTVLALWAYGRWGRLSTQEAIERQGPPRTPGPVATGTGTAHCGSACTLADILGEWLAVGAPGILAWVGLGTVFEQMIFARWVLDFILAFLLGIAFQYFAIVPMRKLAFLPGVWAAVKADTLSLAAWQVGMYGFMAVVHFGLYERVLGARLAVNSFEFWFFMQIGMLCGFATAYPVNAWLIRKGWKERM